MTDVKHGVVVPSIVLTRAGRGKHQPILSIEIDDSYVDGYTIRYDEAKESMVVLGYRQFPAGNVYITHFIIPTNERLIVDVQESLVVELHTDRINLISSNKTPFTIIIGDWTATKSGIAARWSDMFYEVGRVPQLGDEIKVSYNENGDSYLSNRYRNI